FGLSCAYITLGIGYSMHHEGYDAGGWPTMRNAVELTKALNEYSDTVAYTDIERFKTYPQPLRTVRLLIPPALGQPQKHSGQLLLALAWICLSRHTSPLPPSMVLSFCFAVSRGPMGSSRFLFLSPTGPKRHFFFSFSFPPAGRAFVFIIRSPTDAGQIEFVIK